MKPTIDKVRKKGSVSVQDWDNIDNISLLL